MKFLLPVAILLLFALPGRSQTADEIVKNYINALGGSEKIGSIKTVKMDGVLASQGMDIGITLTGSHGVGYRMDIQVPGMADGFQIYVPGKGWKYLPFMGQATVEEMSPEEYKDGQAQLDIHGPLYNYKEKGNTVELIGKETFDGMECYRLKTVNTAGRVLELLIDSKTWYRVKAIGTAGGNQVETIYSNFKKTSDGFIYPFSVTNPNGTVEFSSIETNKPVDPSIFKG